jgi:hypothetical protein
MYTLSSVEVAPMNTIDISVINTPNPSDLQAIPELVSFNLVASPADDSYGIIGPLSAGDYVVPTSVLRDFGGSLYPLDPLCVNPVINHLTVASQSAATVIAPVVEFYDAALDHYFITQNPQEIAALDGGIYKGWARTGQSFLAYAPGQSDNRGRQVCRFYGSPSAGLDSHFFSASVIECLGVKYGPLGTEWLLEGDDVFEITLPNSVTGTCPASTTPVYRLWNDRTDSNHRYTTDPAGDKAANDEQGLYRGGQRTRCRRHVRADAVSPTVRKRAFFPTTFPTCALHGASLFVAEAFRCAMYFAW